MAGQDRDFHEHFEAGIQPHPVLERFYFRVGPGQPFNQVVDITSQIDKKIDAMAACKSQGGHAGSLLRASLSRDGKRLPLLGTDEETADRAYVRQFLLDDFRQYGKPHGLEYAERFYYLDQRQHPNTRVDDYVAQHAVRL